MKRTRRDFLKQSLGASAIVSLGAPIPNFLWRAAAAENGRKETVLVVVQLSGGNDGLNTVVPHRDPAYRQSRPTLAVASADVLRIDTELGFHPAARGLADLLESQQLAIVQGVGYEHPNRSHFESMDIWHTCFHKGGPRATGWLGRCLDATRSDAPQDAPAMHLGAEKQPLALAAANVRVPSISSLERFRLQDGGDQQVRSRINLIAQTPRTPSDGLLGFIQSSTSAALQASERVEQARKDYQTPITYPEHALAEKLRTVAQLIDAGLGTRVYYVTLDGFDTHSQQAPAHAALLGQLASGLHAFLRDLAHHGHDQRVLVMAFSEFGRRVRENASEGTDHGAAAPMFLAGSRVRAGLIGAHPSLTDLDDGDLKFHTDFRQVYATVLERWLGWPSEPVLGGKFAMIDVLPA